MTEPESASPPRHDRVRSAIETRIAAIEAARERVANHEGAADAEAIHDFRVALRRLRSALRPLEVVWGKKPMRRLSERLSAVASRVGELRDEEVLRETLESLRLEGSEFESLGRWSIGRGRREAGLRARAARHVRHDRDETGELSHCLAELSDRMTQVPKRALSDTELARLAIERAFAKVELRAAEARVDDVSAMHRLRIALKQLRYSAELAEELCDLELTKLREVAAKLQKWLGTLHDLDEAQLRMRRAYGLPNEPRAEVLARVRARRASLERRIEHELPRELDRLRRATRHFAQVSQTPDLGPAPATEGGETTSGT